MSWRECYLRSLNYIKREHILKYRHLILNEQRLFECKCLYKEAPFVIDQCHFDMVLYHKNIEFCKWLYGIQQYIISDFYIRNIYFNGDLEMIKWIISLTSPSMPSISEIDNLMIDGHYEVIEFLYSLPSSYIDYIPIEETELNLYSNYYNQRHRFHMKSVGKIIPTINAVDRLLVLLRHNFPLKNRDGSLKILKFLESLVMK